MRLDTARAGQVSGPAKVIDGDSLVARRRTHAACRASMRRNSGQVCERGGPRPWPCGREAQETSQGLVARIGDVDDDVRSWRTATSYGRLLAVCS